MKRSYCRPLSRHVMTRRSIGLRSYHEQKYGNMIMRLHGDVSSVVQGSAYNARCVFTRADACRGASKRVEVNHITGTNAGEKIRVAVRQLA